MGFGTGLAIAGTAISAATSIGGAIQTGNAKKALDNLDVPTLENPFDNARISTMGSDIIKEEGQRRTANILGTLQGGDARNMFTALPSLVAMNNQINQQAALDIDRQMLNREDKKAEYEGRLNDIEEQRYQGELAGYGTLMNVGQQNMWNGINGAITSMGALGRSMDSNQSGVLNPEAKVIGGDLKPAGLSSNYAYSRSSLTPAGIQDLGIQNPFPKLTF
jgi:hypothetical protein